jgi:hypothetical protein
VSRRRGLRNDPISQRVSDEGYLLESVLATLSPRSLGVIAMRFGLTNGGPMTLNEIGKVYGVTAAHVRQLEGWAISKLNHPSRRGGLVVHDGEKLQVIDVRRRVVSDYAEAASRGRDRIVWCSHCGEHRFSSRSLSSTGGRPRKYCSNKCRQAAYRARRARANSP